MKSKGTSSPTDLYAKSGFTIATPKYDLIDISANDMSNLYNSINVTMSWVPTVATSSSGTYPSQVLGRCSITGNTIQAHPSGSAAITSQRVFRGITVQNLFTPSLGMVRSSIDNTYIESNEMHDVYNGIYTNHLWQRRNSYIVLNNIYLRRSTSVQYGINSTLGWKTTMYQNYIDGPASASGDKMKAYYAATNSGLEMYCNEETSCDEGFEFFLTNPGTRWHDNSMNDNHKGYVLNGGGIGPQTWPGLPAMTNRWLGSTWDGTNLQTYVAGTYSSLSPIYVNDNATENPSYNDGVPFSHRYIPASTIFTVSPTAVRRDFAPCYMAPSSPASDTNDVYTMLARSHVPYMYNVVSNNWIGQYSLWKSILMDSTLIDSSIVIAQFAIMANSMSRYKYLTEIENYLVDGNIADATAMLTLNIDSIANTNVDSATQVQIADDTAADYIIANYQQFYSVYIKYIQTAMSSSDSLSLLALANLCPERNGGVVYQARALYSLVFDDFRIFNDDSCLEVDTSFIGSKHSYNNRPQRVVEGQRYFVYPNPNNGNFTLQQYLKDEELIDVIIYDALGRIFIQKEVQFVTKKHELNLSGIAPGMYMLELKDRKGETFRYKIVVN